MCQSNRNCSSFQVHGADQHLAVTEACLHSSGQRSHSHQRHDKHIVLAGKILPNCSTFQENIRVIFLVDQKQHLVIIGMNHVIKIGKRCQEDNTSIGSPNALDGHVFPGSFNDFVFSFTQFGGVRNRCLGHDHFELTSEFGHEQHSDANTEPMQNAQTAGENVSLDVTISLLNHLHLRNMDGRARGLGPVPPFFPANAM